MPVRLPTLEQIDDLGADFGLVLTAEEIAAFQQAFKGPLASYGRLDELVPPALAPIAPRSPGYRPAASENPYGAWYWKTNIHAGMGISFEDYCRLTGNPDFIAPDRIADIILFCYKQPQAICIRDLVVMPTTSAY